MKRNFGRLIALLFGLVLLTEVGVLPLFSSFATKIENSVIAELADFEEKEKFESLSALQLATFESAKEFALFKNQKAKPQNGNPKNPDVGPATDVFLQHRSLRL